MSDVGGLHLFELPQQFRGLLDVAAGSLEHLDELLLDVHMPLAGDK